MSPTLPQMVRTAFGPTATLRRIDGVTLGEVVSADQLPAMKCIDLPGIEAREIPQDDTTSWWTVRCGKEK